MFLREIGHYIQRREDFAFETTLSGRGYLRLIRRLLADGWRVDLYYLWLPSVEMCIERVAERVAHGGHDIPRDSIIRRYSRSIANLLAYYAPLCSSTICVDNSTTVPEVIFVQSATGRTVENRKLFEAMRQGAGHDRTSETSTIRQGRPCARGRPGAGKKTAAGAIRGRFQEWQARAYRGEWCKRR